MPPTAPAATPAQIEALLNFMTENRELARGLLRGADGRLRSKNMWESLCNSLNSMGGCTKTVEQWQRVWADRKHLAKKAAGAARRSACSTGGGPSTAPTLSEIELKILSIMGEGFGEPQTEARVPAFPLSATASQGPAADTTPARPHSPQLPEQPSTSAEALEWELPQQRQQTNRVRPPRIRQLGANSARSRILNIEEQRLESDRIRNEVLRQMLNQITEFVNIFRERFPRQ